MEKARELGKQLNDADDEIDNIKEKKIELEVAKDLLTKEMQKFQKECLDLEKQIQELQQR